MIQRLVLVTSDLVTCGLGTCDVLNSIFVACGLVTFDSTTCVLVICDLYTCVVF